MCLLHWVVRCYPYSSVLLMKADELQSCCLLRGLNRSGLFMGLLPWNVSHFPMGLPQRPTSVDMEISKPSTKVYCMCAFTMLGFRTKYICLWVKVPLLSSCSSQNDLVVKPAPSVWLFSLPILVPSLFPSFSLPPFCGATALRLYYTAYLLRPCVYIQSSTRFLLTLEAELTSKNYSFSSQFCRTDLGLV